MPGSPAERRQKALDPPAPELHLCPHCGERHQPIDLMAGGMADLMGRSLLPDPTRPEPLGRGDADTVSLRRDHFNPWR